MMVLRVRPAVGPRTSGAPTDVAAARRAREGVFPKGEVHGIGRETVQREGRPMDILYERCAGLDVHKKTVVACRILRQGDGQVVR